MRTDFTFRFSIPKYDVAEAKFKVETDTIGDIIANYDQYWDLPDEWLFKQKQTSLRVQIFGYILAIASLVALISAIWWATGIAKSGAIHFRTALLLSIVPAVIVIPQVINSLPQFYIGYGTDTRLFYFTTELVTQIITVFTAMAIIAALATFALAAFKLISPR